MVENLSHSRRSQISITDLNIKAVRELSDGDRLLTISEIASEVEMSFANTQKIITVDLSLQKVSASLVPRLLIDAQKETRFGTCERLLARYQADRAKIFEALVTCDEIWVHPYSLEWKRGSKEWRKPGERVHVKAKIRLPVGKVLMTVFGDY